MTNTELLEKVIKLSKLAGDAILKVYESDDFDVEKKQDDQGFESPLTKADKAAHETIVEGLATFSEHDVVSEEGHMQVPSTELWWLVDPLDGTKEFVKRNGEFTVNIALMKGNRPILGVVYVPVQDVYYCGDVESGRAFKIEHGNRMNIKALPPAGKPTIVVSRSHREGKTQDLLDSIGEFDEISMGSSLKLCLVAEGKAALYPRLAPTSLWDTAAADAVVTAAGGAVKNLEGKVLVYEPAVEILNPHFVVESANNTIDWQKHLN